MRTLTGIVLALLAVLMLGACTTSVGGSFDFSGQWTGTIQDSAAGTGTVSTSITQNGNDLGGTWSAQFASGNNGGSLLGIVNNSSVVLELYPSNPSACPFRVVANRSGNTLTGDYASFSCTATVTGTLTITRQ